MDDLRRIEAEWNETLRDGSLEGSQRAPIGKTELARQILDCGAFPVQPIENPKKSQRGFLGSYNGGPGRPLPTELFLLVFDHLLDHRECLGRRWCGRCDAPVRDRICTIEDHDPEGSLALSRTQEMAKQHMTKKQVPRPRGRKPKRLKIEGSWEEAIARTLRKKPALKPTTSKKAPKPETPP